MKFTFLTTISEENTNYMEKYKSNEKLKEFLLHIQ